MLGSQTTIFWNSDFYGVEAPDDFELRKYKRESHDISYNEASRSKEISLGFSINWVYQKKWRIEQQFLGAIGTFTETINHSLTGIGNGDTLGAMVGYAKNEIPLNYKSSGNFFGQQWGLQTNVLFVYEWENGFGIGSGFNYTYTQRDGNSLVKQSGYLPNVIAGRNKNERGSYFGFSLYGEKKWDIIGLNFVLGQAVIPFRNNEMLKPTSMNISSRLPFIWNIGLSVSFDEVR